MKAYTTSPENLLRLVWQDLGTTQIMTTIHSVEDIETFEFISSQKRRGSLLNSVIETIDGNQAFLSPLLICKYNKHMGESDANLQCKSYYLANIRCFRYWWLLFRFFLDASVLN